MGRSLLHTHNDEILTEDRTYVCSAEEHERREKSLVLVLNSQCKNGPMTQREGHAGNSIPANWHGNERINLSQDSVKEPNELTRKMDGDGILLLPHQARLRHDANQQTNGCWHRVGMNSVYIFSIPIARCCAYRQWRLFCKRRRV